jgi:hypothetical protein
MLLSSTGIIEKPSRLEKGFFLNLPDKLGKSMKKKVDIGKRTEYLATAAESAMEASRCQSDDRQAQRPPQHCVKNTVSIEELPVRRA